MDKRSFRQLTLATSDAQVVNTTLFPVFTRELQAHEFIARVQQQLVAPTQTHERCLFGIWEGFGCLEDGIRRAPSFEIPGRRWHLFYAPIGAIEQTFCTNRGSPLSRVADVLVLLYTPDYTPDVAFSTDTPPIASMPIPYQSANVWWPEDRAWCVATEIDFMTTYLAGSQEAVTAVLGNEDLEAYQVDPADGVAYASDKINPAPVER